LAAFLGTGLNPLTFTLLSDGSSDRALLPVLRWLLRQSTTRNLQSQWADLRHLRNPPKKLGERIQAALDLYPCDLLFVHRDAEGEPRQIRVEEIRRHLPDPHPPAICVVPVRMQETWLLFDEYALRVAADNPRGRVPLAVPVVGDLEAIPNAKDLLFKLLEIASELKGRRLRRLNVPERVHRLADLIQDFSPLRRLSAFEALEEDVRRILTERSWQ
jgi:hypothetical protein